MKNLIVLVALLSLTACNTMSGIGKDITQGAEWTKGKMNSTPEQPKAKPAPAPVEERGTTKSKFLGDA
jgi:predicted small secreted protein